MGATLIGSNDTILATPGAITGDPTGVDQNIYVLDGNWIVKFNSATGAYVGWTGGIGTTPTGGTCNPISGAPAGPNWCQGGSAASGTGNSYLNNPQSLYYYGGYLYVSDMNHRGSKFSATTGVFAGWIGRQNAAPSSQCNTRTVINSGGTHNYNYNGWCMGGTAQRGVDTNYDGYIDPGGGFHFDVSYGNINGITGDGTYLYIANFWEQRIDRFNISTGNYVNSVNAEYGAAGYTDHWTTAWAPTGTFPTITPAAPTSPSWGWSSWSYSATAMYTDGTSIYVIPSAVNGSNPIIVKRDVRLTGTTNGSVLGWEGATADSNVTANVPTGGAPGCTTPANVTAGWCVGGVGATGYTLGQFNNPQFIAGDANFIYITDSFNNRVTRIPR